ncbi:hypothetical protein ACPPVT_02895 [Angustibacter sp. McL0619]|uniref:hypothetical protein n=1 Tax=Angustibacter sp. McL0619 TaxID=3415676 RepID=UPI003CEB9791
MMRPIRRGLVALAVVGSMTLLASCAVFSPKTTNENYDAADGVTANLGEIVARDLLVVGSKGEQGLLSGAIVNNGTDDASVTITAKGQPQPVTVSLPGGALVTLGNGEDQTNVVVGNLTVEAGSMLDVTISTPTGGQVVTPVPVLPAEGPFATVTPTAD